MANGVARTIVREKPDFKAHEARAKRAWSNREAWQTLYDECYDYVIPYRRPESKRSRGAQRLDRAFDNTAIQSNFRFAGQLQQDMFPTGQPFFALRPGPVLSVAAKREGGDLTEVQRRLDDTTAIVSAVFMTGEFDAAINETFIDLGIGTGAILLVKGDTRHPVRFVNIPIDELAIDLGPYNDIAGIFWKTRMSRRQIKEAFPQGEFSDDFSKKHGEDPEGDEVICQDFTRDGDRWRFVAYVEGSDAPIARARYRTQPIAVVRFHRVPGEDLGRGPALTALPTVKTLNKAMELTLKAAAIALLGIWAYRPGGAFNPDTARIAPGAWWPMSSTGGMLGPDVTRMDTGGREIQVGELMTNELRTQVRGAMYDDQLPNMDGATPRSASEIMARMKRISENYMGAFGRLTYEIVPVVVRRAIEILYDLGILDTEVSIDDLLIRVDVISPIAQALKAGAMARIIEWFQLVIALKGTPQALEMVAKVDDALAEIARETGVPSEFVMTKAEREKLQKQLGEAMAVAAAAQAAAAQGGQPGAGAPAPGAAPMGAAA